MIIGPPPKFHGTRDILSLSVTTQRVDASKPAEARDRHGVAAVVMLSRSCGHGCAAGVRWSVAAQRREKLPAGDHRDDLPRRCDRAEPAYQGRRGHSEHGHGIGQRGAGRDDRRQHRVELVGRDGALDAQPLGARPHPSDPAAHRVRGYVQVGANCAMAWPKALASKAWPTTSITLPRRAGASAGSST